jgi:phage baseplate assembly protein V
MSKIPGVVIGVVNAVDDPNGEGRIRVDFPWMGGSNKSYWAPVVTFMSGNGRGSWFMPEVGDEVVVAFDHGEIDHPFVLGFVWNGQDKPPETDVHKRFFKSVKGHSILFDDDDGEEKVAIATNGGQKITLDDVAKTIEVTTASGVKITLDDTSSAITIQASQKVTINAAQVEVASPDISLGQAASHPSVFGDLLLDYLTELTTIFQSHLHVGEMAAGIIPVVPAPPITPMPPPIPVELLSLIVKDA